MKFLAEADALIITLEGFEVFFGVKRRLVIPRSAITELHWQPDLVFTQRIWRVLGAGIPGVLYAGHFRGGGERYYLYLREPRGISWAGVPVEARNVLVITTQDYPFKQILLTCEPDIGASLMNWWRETQAAA
jgi:hypothetical protein